MVDADQRRRILGEAFHQPFGDTAPRPGCCRNRPKARDTLRAVACLVGPIPCQQCYFDFLDLFGDVLLQEAADVMDAGRRAPSPADSRSDPRRRPPRHFRRMVPGIGSQWLRCSSNGRSRLKSTPRFFMLSYKAAGKRIAADFNRSFPNRLWPRPRKPDGILQVPPGRCPRWPNNQCRHRAKPQRSSRR